MSVGVGISLNSGLPMSSTPAGSWNAGAAGAAGAAGGAAGGGGGGGGSSEAGQPYQVAASKKTSERARSFMGSSSRVAGSYTRVGRAVQGWQRIDRHRARWLCEALAAPWAPLPSAN